MASPSVKFEVKIQVSKREENLYAATIMPFQVTGYADTFDGSIDRSKKGLDHLLEAYESDGNLTQFLDESGVEYTVTDDTPARGTSMRRVKETIAYVGSHQRLYGLRTFRRYGFIVHQTSDDWLIIRFPYPSARIGMLDVSEGYTYWDDLKYWADETGVERNQFED